MSVLSGKTIAETIGYPWEPIHGSRKDLANPASVNLRLGRSFKTIAPNQLIKLGEEVKYEHIRLDKNECVTIQPHEFMLATTMESIELPANMVGLVMGRSSLARIGLSVEIAGLIDPGFHGHITLELYNQSENPIVLKPEYEVCQIMLLETNRDCMPYNGKYNGQEDATGSRMMLDRPINLEVSQGLTSDAGIENSPARTPAGANAADGAKWEVDERV